MGPYRKNSGTMAGIELYKCPNTDLSVSPAYTNRTVSANFRGPEYPQGFFGIQSMMDDVAHQLRIDPVEFALKNMSRMARDETPYTELHPRGMRPPRRRAVRLGGAPARRRPGRTRGRSSAAPA